MEAYEIVEIDGDYLVLAFGRPQLSFPTLEQAHSAVRQVQALDNLPQWPIPCPGTTLLLFR